jgi:hypothetical protein
MLQTYFVVPEMKSHISWMFVCLYSQPLTVLTWRLLEDVIELRAFLYVLEKVHCILNAMCSFLMTVLFQVVEKSRSLFCHLEECYRPF